MSEENTGLSRKASHDAGAQAAHDLAAGKISKEELIRRHKEHKENGPEGAGEEFQIGYGEGARDVFKGH